MQKVRPYMQYHPVDCSGFLFACNFQEQHLPLCTTSLCPYTCTLFLCALSGMVEMQGIGAASEGTNVGPLGIWLFPSSTAPYSCHAVDGISAFIPLRWYPQGGAPQHADIQLQLPDHPLKRSVSMSQSSKHEQRC